MREVTTGGRRAPRTDRPNVLRVLRFDGVQRAVHWANAVLFFILLLTALPLYFPSIERVVGRHVLLVQIHVWAGIAFPVPLLISIAGPWGKRMRRDLGRFNRWTKLELRWLQSFGTARGLDQDKFNPGQKLNAIFTGAAMTLLLASGIVLKWFGLFPLSWRSGATFVHEVLAFLIVATVAGHIAMALTHREALWSMLQGSVSVAWAKAHAPRWWRELGGGHDRGADTSTHHAPDGVSLTEAASATGAVRPALPGRPASTCAEGP